MVHVFFFRLEGSNQGRPRSPQAAPTPEQRAALLKLRLKLGAQKESPARAASLLTTSPWASQGPLAPSADGWSRRRSTRAPSNTCWLCSDRSSQGGSRAPLVAGWQAYEAGAGSAAASASTRHGTQHRGRKPAAAQPRAVNEGLRTGV